MVTLPKIVTPEQVGLLADIFDEMEPKLGLAAGSLKMEMMIETTQSIIAPDGQINLPRMLEAARGRCTAAHFGTYDYTASCSITAAYQDMLHPACDFARSMMQVAFGGTGVWLSDGATNIMPVAPHRGDITPEQEAENRLVVHRAWKLHYDHIRHSLANAFYQGWDLHPGQLPTRYAAVYTFFLEGLDAASERLKKLCRESRAGDLGRGCIRRRGDRPGPAQLLPAGDQLRRHHRGRSGRADDDHAGRAAVGVVCEDTEE